MAWKDLLNKAKKAVESAGEAVSNYAAKAEAQRQEEQARLAEEKARQEAERNGLPALPTFTCPHGGCKDIDGTLFCACAPDCQCPDGIKQGYGEKEIWYMTPEILPHAVRMQDLPYDRKREGTLEYLKQYYPAFAEEGLEKLQEQFDYLVDVGKEPELWQRRVLDYFNERGDIGIYEDINIYTMCFRFSHDDGSESPLEELEKQLVLLFFDDLKKDPLFFLWNPMDFYYALSVMQVIVDPVYCDMFMDYVPGNFYKLFNEDWSIKSAGLDKRDPNDTNTIYGMVETWTRELGHDNGNKTLNEVILGSID